MFHSASTPLLCLGFLCASTALVSAQLPFRTTIDSPRNRTAFSAASATLGDVDGDGVADFAISEVSGAAFTPIDEVYIFSGATGALLRTLSGASTDQNFGGSVAGPGDVDGDGTPDILIGAPTDNAVATSSGFTALYSGATGAEIYAYSGANSFSACGEAVAAVGDISGDGVPDFMVAFPGEDMLTVPALGHDGVVRVYSGANGSVIHALQSQAAADSSDGWARRLAGAGDVDGDGVRDLLVGSSGRIGRIPTGSLGRVGAVECYSGATGALLFELQDLTPTLRFNHGFGNGLAGGTDLNGDGRCEILVGATGAQEVGSNIRTGALYVYDGATQNLIIKHLGDAQGDGSFGYEPCFMGDTNGDGISEYAAAYDYTGTVGYSGYVRVFCGATHRVITDLQSPVHYDGLGSTLTPLGDVDGDRIPDLLVGARQARAAYVMSIAGARRYGVGLEPTQLLDLRWEPGTSSDLLEGRVHATGAVPFTSGVFLFSVAQANFDFLGATILVFPSAPSGFALPMLYDSTGEYDSGSVNLRQPGSMGISFSFQLLAIDASSPIGITTSNGLELRFIDA